MPLYKWILIEFKWNLALNMYSKRVYSKHVLSVMAVAFASPLLTGVFVIMCFPDII